MTKEKKSKAQIKTDVLFVYEDTEMYVGGAGGKRIFVGMAPFPAKLGIRSKAKWTGICPYNEKVARYLSQVFGEIADAYAEKEKKI